MDSIKKSGRLIPRAIDPGPPAWATDPEGRLKSSHSAIKVALTGGLASGKSTVAALFEVFGAARLDFDQLARQAVVPGGECHQQVAELLGPRSVKADGQLDRTFIGRKVFKDKELRLALEALIHPETWRLMFLWLKETPPKPVTVIEIPLLFEARLNTLFDRIVLSFASQETQLSRLLYRNPKLGKRQALRMIESQMPMTEKLRRADMIIDNNGHLPIAIHQTKDLWDKLTAGLA
jgi:dephospho-CoA kinase